MTDEDEFAARSQLKWTREGDAWILLYRRRRMGRVVPDKDHSGMWRSVKVDGILSAATRAVRILCIKVTPRPTLPLITAKRRREAARRPKSSC